jgi:hypothetical protein
LVLEVRTLTLESIERIKAFAAALSAAISEDPWLKKSAETHTQQYMQTLRKQAADPTHLVSTDGRVLKGEDIGYLTYIGGPMGLAVSWLCRDLRCGWYGENHFWFKAVSEHFACPRCLMEYRPWSGWADKKNKHPAFPAQKVVSYTSSSGVHSAWPMVWPESAGDQWLNRLIEDRAVHVKAVQKDDLMPFLQRNIAEIDKMVSKIARPARFVHMPANEGIANKDQSRWPRENWEPVVAKGVHGAYMDLKDPELKPFEDHNELIAFFANVLSGGQQLAGRK